MTDFVRLENQVITDKDVILDLRLRGKFETILEDIVRDRLVVLAAKRSGIEVTDDEVQTRADHLRRVMELHRAADMMAFLQDLETTVEVFADHVRNMLLHEKKEKEITSDAAVEEYFKLNSPKYDAVEVAHIVMTSEGAAQELLAMLEDDPSQFSQLASEHSIADTKAQGGVIGNITRGESENENEAKIFNSDVNVPIGPFESPDGQKYEIFMVLNKIPAQLDSPTKSQIRRKLYDDWVSTLVTESGVELL